VVGLLLIEKVRPVLLSAPYASPENLEVRSRADASKGTETRGTEWVDESSDA
jgi:hypothetical protein